MVEELDLGDVKKQVPIKKGSIAGKPWANANTGTVPVLANKSKSERIASRCDEGVPDRDRGENGVEDGSKGLVLSEHGTNYNSSSRTETARTAAAVSAVSLSKHDGISNEGASAGAAPVAFALECPEQVSIHRVASTSTMSSLDSGMRQNASSGSGTGRDQREVSPLASPASRVRLSLSLGALSLCCGESTVDESAYSPSRYPHPHAHAHAVTPTATAVTATATSTVYASASSLQGGKELSGKSSPCPSTVTVASPTPSGFDSPVSFEAARNHFTKPQSRPNENEGDRSDGGGGGGGGGGSKASSPHRDRGRGNSVVINGSIISLLEKFNGSGNRRNSDEKSTERRPLFDLGEVSANRTLPSVVKKTRVLATSCSPTRSGSVADTTTNVLSSHNNNNKSDNSSMVDNMIADSSEISSVASISSSVFVSASDGSTSHPSKVYGTVITIILQLR